MRLTALTAHVGDSERPHHHVSHAQAGLTSPAWPLHDDDSGGSDAGLVSPAYFGNIGTASNAYPE